MSNAGKCTSVNNNSNNNNNNKKNHRQYLSQPLLPNEASPSNFSPHNPTRTRRQETKNTRETHKESLNKLWNPMHMWSRREKRKKKKSRPSGTPRERGVVVLEKVCMRVSLSVMRCVCVSALLHKHGCPPSFPPTG